ncbi:YeiH family protein [Marixanthomonas spongiae]|uniref:Putative sulfate exporter family transporter n=1 Tax=Marixanthomonas spongiae TaxID=2174845 RepID=A0A2U0HVF5_9FLAO|nr:putative sulfate exporter family transporter [Marixanthomonas spongiae]PVW12824.1 putative sulfate exporter family transporter [Marixanthomonas spongiae]
MQLKKIFYILLALLTLLPIINAPIALVAGIAFSLLLGNPFAEQTAKFSKVLLKLSIVGLGFGLNAINAFEVSKDGFLITIVTISLVFGLGYLFNKFFKIEKITALLISSGTAICGGSAIASVSPIVKAKNEQISIAIGVVFLLNALALLIFPFIGHFFELSQYQFGLWSAIAIHDTSSVVGAAQAFGKEALEVATTVKLSRALWIVPVTLIISYFHNKSKGATGIKIPSFILAFIAATVIATIFSQGQVVYDSISAVSRQLLVTTLFFIGSGISLSQIKKVGAKSIFYATGLWIVISIFSLVLILNNF